VGRPGCSDRRRPRQVSDPFFWRELGLQPGVDRKQIKRAYWQLARQNHPDYFPEERKAVQELRMIALNEAYAHLMSGPDVPGDSLQPRHSERFGFDASWSDVGAGRPAPERSDLGYHKDPSYAYYKQGFVHYSRAVHGIEALYRSLTQRGIVHFKPRDDAYHRFAEGLVELRRAHEYFSRVVQEFEQSIWRHDARMKLRRIERFTVLYRRILGNLTENG